jgi:hypothetical protein
VLLPELKILFAAGYAEAGYHVEPSGGMTMIVAAAGQSDGHGALVNRH